jgi:uncharacterized RDD family membrane protein YckC
VAARYAQAPSYSQMQTEALDARIALPKALPGPLEASAEAFPGDFDAVLARTPYQPSTQALKPDVVPAHPAVPPSLEAWESEDFRPIREPDFALSPPEPVPQAADKLIALEGHDLSHTVSDEESPRALQFAEKGGRSSKKCQGTSSVVPQMQQNTCRALAPEENISPISPDTPAISAVYTTPLPPREPGEPVLLTHANIIEFPRELVAPRKRRPRRAEGRFAADGLELQLSIFEVDPGALSMQPETAVAAPAWPSPEWASIELEAQPADEPQPEEPQSAPASMPDLRRSPIGLRVLAALVDGALVAAAVLGSALVAAAGIGHPIPAEIARFSVLLGLLLAGLLYMTIFLILDEATPGMACSALSLYTLDGEIPTRSQRCLRMAALLLSVLPAGLGAAWLLFDDDHLCWHDRFSRTYLRKG